MKTLGQNLRHKRIHLESHLRVDRALATEDMEQWSSRLPVVRVQVIALLER